MRFLAAKWRRERDSNPCEIALKRFSRPPRYDHFDIPPYKRNYEIVLEKTLEEKTLLSEKCACLPQIQGFFADCFRYGKEVSRPPRYDRFDTSPYLIYRYILPQSFGFVNSRAALSFTLAHKNSL